MSEEMNMEELLAQESIPEIREHTTVTGEVIQVNKDEAYVDIGYKQEIPIPKRELAYPTPESAMDVVKVGDKIDVYINSLGGDNGGSLSKVKADRMVAWTELEKLKEEGKTVEAHVNQVVKGGLVASVNGLRGFIPASQMELHFVKDLSIYLDQTVEAEIIEIDVHKQRLVLSRRSLLEVERKKREEEVFSHTDLYDFRANIEGAEKIFELFKPLIKNKDEKLVKTLELEFKNVNGLLDKHMTDSENYKLYTELTKEDTKELAEAVTKLGEPLSQMGVILNGE